ncbi:hypothetical protein OAO18_03960 [Francisellaceae bacterium]|nr:hypothetical protein [Francisellaceae bacterium]
MKKIQISLIILLSSLSMNSFSFWDKVVDAATDSDNISALTSKIENVGIENPEDQDLWNSFVQDCIVNHVSTDKLISLASSSSEQILTFLTTFQAPTGVMTTAYDKVMSCPHALPLAQKILKTVTLG